MTACIVGWSHLPFGRRDHDDVESMICSVASEAINDSGFSPAISTPSIWDILEVRFPTRFYVKPGFSILGCVAFQACYKG